MFNGMAAGIFTLINDKEDFWINSISGALLSGAWMANTFQAHILAINSMITWYGLIYAKIKTQVLIAIQNQMMNSFILSRFYQMEADFIAYSKCYHQVYEDDKDE
uniref:Uncharacterized protein n=1 Tax=Romanomermis culicivorax TaxID=13658 RepID=A0A915KYW2_ROMCU